MPPFGFDPPLPYVYPYAQPMFTKVYPQINPPPQLQFTRPPHPPSYLLFLHFNPLTQIFLLQPPPLLEAMEFT